MTKLPSEIAIIGVGLIGGSIALGLKAKLGSDVLIWGLCHSQERTKKALIKKIIDKDIKDLEKLQHAISLVIIAVPLSQVKEIVLKLSQNHQKLLVIDVSGTKSEIKNIAKNIHKKNMMLLGTHPMAGKELQGFENAQADLFSGKPWIICPDSDIRVNEMQIIKTLISNLGGIPLIMSAVKHDKIASLASHLPLIFGSIVMNFMCKNKAWSEICNIGSSGLKDITRLASHDPKVKLDIIQSNKKNVLRGLLLLQKEIRLFITLIKNEKYAEILSYLKHSKITRDQWINNPLINV